MGKWLLHVYYVNGSPLHKTEMGSISDMYIHVYKYIYHLTWWGSSVVHGHSPACCPAHARPWPPTTPTPTSLPPVLHVHRAKYMYQHKTLHPLELHLAPLQDNILPMLNMCVLKESGEEFHMSRTVHINRCELAKEIMHGKCTNPKQNSEYNRKKTPSYFGRDLNLCLQSSI